MYCSSLVTLACACVARTVMKTRYYVVGWSQNVADDLNHALNMFFFFKLVKPTLTNILGAKRQRSAAISVLSLLPNHKYNPFFSNVTLSAYFLIINRNNVLHSPLGPNILILGCSRPFTWYLPWANFLFPWCPPPSRTANGPFYSCTLGPFPK